tara:strand:- start:873 stop:1565 length:693 start_codon:yes stop_codon:yes gene_type:complete
MENKNKEQAMEQISYGLVWKTLSKIDVSDKVEKKMNLSYLSWSYAWSTMMDYFPDAQYTFYENQETGVPYVVLPDGTAEVRCRVTIGSLAREMWLPVMDFKNNAVINPNASEVNKAKMRSLVKTLGMYGLGINIYAGTDLPIPDKQTKTKEDISEQKEESEPKVKDEHDENWANLFLDGIQVPLKMCKDIEQMNSIFIQNKPSIDIIESRHKDIFVKIVELFKTKKGEIS